MKTQLLIVVGLLFILPNLFAQEIPDKNNLFAQRKHFLPHIQLHEKGYYYVDKGLMYPINDRSDKPVLEGLLYSVVNALGDTTFTRKQIYTISNDNRITKIEYQINYFETNASNEKSYADFIYENQGDSLIQQTTTYLINDNGDSIPSERYIININPEGLVTSYIWQFYFENQWVNSVRMANIFNDFNCPISKTRYYWKNNNWSQNLKEIGICDKEMLLKVEYFWGEEEIYFGFDENEFDENQNIISKVKFVLNDEDPEIIEERFLDLYYYNEENSLDSARSLKWDSQENEFFITTLYTIMHDEFNNRLKVDYFRNDNSDTLFLHYQANREFDYNYFNGDYLDGNEHPDVISMPLKTTINYSSGSIHNTQYFYSTGSVSSVEQSNNIHFEVFPNPTSGELNIKFSGLVTPNSNIIVRNSTGAVVMNQIADGVNNLNVGHLPSGMYFISVEGSDSRSEIKKFVKL